MKTGQPIFITCLRRASWLLSCCCCISAVRPSATTRSSSAVARCSWMAESRSARAFRWAASVLSRSSCCFLTTAAAPVSATASRPSRLATFAAPAATCPCSSPRRPREASRSAPSRAHLVVSSCPCSLAACSSRSFAVVRAAASPSSRRCCCVAASVAAAAAAVRCCPSAFSRTERSLTALRSMEPSCLRASSSSCCATAWPVLCASTSHWAAVSFSCSCWRSASSCLAATSSAIASASLVCAGSCNTASVMFFRWASASCCSPMSKFLPTIEWPSSSE